MKNKNKEKLFTNKTGAQKNTAYDFDINDAYVLIENDETTMHYAAQSKSRKKDQYFKILFVSEPETHDLKETIEVLDEVKLRQFDVVFLIGDAPAPLLREASILFESALILQLPKTYFLKNVAKEYFVTNFNKKAQKIETARMVGFGQDTVGQCLEMPVGDIVISNVAPDKDLKLREFIAKNKPIYVFYPGNEFTQTKIDGTLYVSLVGTLPLIVPNPQRVIKKRKRALRMAQKLEKKGIEK